MPNKHADLPDLKMDEAASSSSLTASPGSTLNGQQPIFSQSQQKQSASLKRSDQSDDKITSLTIKKRKNESSTEDNNLIITSYQPEKNDKNFTLNLVAAITNIPADMTIETAPGFLSATSQLGMHYPEDSLKIRCGIKLNYFGVSIPLRPFVRQVNSLRQ
ncbi:hypothetical protein RCL_jg14733.t1 [Rhizophagus clarus]|uniref:Uncharacterized protein n=1 Tax=Rhizophagus clarus TaxID=94130 RepID=A0A8H3M355_9GLOM|nr:hypothetical protein RCL_jg14733.t1 [Rhizophagus clarus]